MTAKKYGRDMDFGTIDFDYAASLATADPATDGPIWMVNFMKYKARADYGEQGDHGISGREADDRYAPVEILDELGAVVTYFGDVTATTGRLDEQWDRMGIVRYPTRRSFIEMQSRNDFKEKVVHKEAGMEFTVIMCALPVGPVHGAPDGSGVVRFIAIPEGVAPPASLDEGVLFEVEGTVIGDERRWGHLIMSWSAEPNGLVEGAMVVHSRPLIDVIGATVGEQG